MIYLTKENLTGNNRKSSKGNQLKWFYNGYWYKADNNGYEGLSEYVTSKLLTRSSLKSREFVDYEPEEINYENRVFKGCRSRTFLKEEQRLITLQRLYQAYYSKDLQDEMSEIYNPVEKCERLVNIVENLTGLKNFGSYLLKMVLIDALFLNEDRHYHNIAFIEENGTYSYCPIFDNGAALLSDTRLDYPLEGDELEMIKNVRSKTIMEDFDELLTALERLYSCDLYFTYSDADTIDVVSSAVQYNEEIRKRVARILIRQRQRYQGYFN